MNDVAYILRGAEMVIIAEGKTYNIGPSHVNYTLILDAIKSGETDDIIDLLDVPAAITRRTEGLVEVTDGEVFYDGQRLHNTLTDRMLDMLAAGYNIDPLIAFLENLMENPSKRAVDELYLFLETNNMPITPDGHFLAYKNVRENYMDIHSGTFDNSIGSVNSVPRNSVDDERDRTCSYGLHFCSLAYLQSFPGAHTMILKINPRDVVSIPSDYNNTKGRCCRYEVVGEHEGEDRYRREAYNEPVVSVGANRDVVSYDLDDGLIVDEFENLEEAAEAYGIPASYIKRVLSGERKSTAGVGWAYADSYEEPESFIDDEGVVRVSEDPFGDDFRNW